MIYFDNAATTKMLCEVQDVMSIDHGNPSSLHYQGIAAERELTSARKLIADKLGVKSKELTFTSGATEANNLALFGFVRANKRKGNHIITTKIEHPSVSMPLKELEKEGFEISFVKPTKEAILGAIKENTILISMMTVNNETGKILPVSEVARSTNVPVHTDLVQAFMKIDTTDVIGHVAMASISAHKLHGPKGVGALYVKNGVKLSPILYGGGQEGGLRSGTENITCITAFAEALKLQKVEPHWEITDYLVSRLQEIEGGEILFPPEAPHIVSFYYPKYNGEVVVRMLSENGICASTGSACSRGKKSSVLRELGVSPKKIDGALRLSPSLYTSTHGVDKLIEILKNL